MDNPLTQVEARTAVAPHPLEFLFHPCSIAVVGASPDPRKQGYRYVRALQEFSFPGKLYAVNPYEKEVLGLPAYPSLEVIPGPVDYVISCIPASRIFPLVEECIAKGVKALQLYTARLAETGEPEKRAAEARLVEMARRAGIRLIGPNCMGLYYPRGGISFRLNFPKESGRVGFTTQSAAHAAEVVYRASLRGVRFSKVAHYGNASDLNETSFLEYLAQDEETKVIGCYIEGIKDGPAFRKALSSAAQAKPVIVLKGGRTEGGRKAAAAHTASLAGDDAVWDALCLQYGAMRADGLEELIDLLVAFAFLPPLPGRRAGVVASGGGGSVIVADACLKAGLTLPALPEDIRARMRELAPETWMMLGNPIDSSIVGDAEVQAELVKMMALHPAYDFLMVDLGMEWWLDSPLGEAEVSRVLAAVTSLAATSSKPVIAGVRSADCPEPWRWQASIRFLEECGRRGLANYPSLSRAASAIARHLSYWEGRTGRGR